VNNPLNFLKQPSKHARIKALEATVDRQNEALKYTTIALQAARDITTATTDDTGTTEYHYTCNPYPQYVDKVKALTAMYRGLKKFGNSIAKSVVDVRSAFLIGSGIQVIKREGFTGSAERELKFIQDFMTYNNLDEEVPQAWARDAEIEGKFLVTLEVDKNPLLYKAGIIRTVPKPWYSFPYTIQYMQHDPSHYTRAFYTGDPGSGAPMTEVSPNSKDTSFDLSENGFIYRKFAGTLGDVNKTPSKVAMVLWNIQSVDMAYWDWRQINHLYASPTPFFKFDDADAAKKFKEEMLDHNNWRIGMGIALGGEGCDFKLICYTGEGYTTVKDEILYHARRISGDTGVPIHFFGYPDLLSNRDTADNLIEGIVLATSKERHTWVGFYEELFQKAILLYNKNFKNNLNEHAITAKIPSVSSAKMVEIEKVWLPMYMNSAISLETLLAQLAEVDVDPEVERIKAAVKEKVANEAVFRNASPGNGEQQNN